MLNAGYAAIAVFCGLLLANSLTLQPVTITVHAGDNLQAKLRSAHCGDSVIADAGLTFVAPHGLGMIFPNIGSCGANPAVFTSTQAAGLPPVFDIPDNSRMVRIVTEGDTPAVTFEAGAQGWKIVGVEITSIAQPTKYISELVTGGNVLPAPTNITFDRCWIHSVEDGTDTLQATAKIGIFVEGSDWTVINSRVSLPAYAHGDNTSAISTIRGERLTIHNSFISAWFAPLFVGGGDLLADNQATVLATPAPTLHSARLSNTTGLEPGMLVPMADDTAENHDNSNQGYHGLWYEVAKIKTVDHVTNDITFDPEAGSIGSKADCTGDCGLPLKRAPLSPGSVLWGGRNPSVSWTKSTVWINPAVAAKVFAQYGRVPKGWMEAKAGTIYLEGLDITGWPATAAWTQHNQTGAFGGRSPWSKLSVTMKNCRGVNVVKPNGRKFGSQLFGILGEDNVGTSVVGGPFVIENCLFDYGGRVADLFGGTDVTFRHCTFINDVGWANGSLLTINYIPTLRFTFENNIAWNNEYGINFQSGGSLPGAKIAGNILVTETISPYRPNCTNVYPAGNFCPQTVTLENYQLPAGTPFKGKGTDGKDPGVDMAQLLAALGGAIPNPTPAPTASPAPSASPSASPSPIPTPSPSPSVQPAAEEGGREAMQVEWPNDKAERSVLWDRLTKAGWSCPLLDDKVLYCKRP